MDNDRRGFTIFEIIVVMAIMVIIGVVSYVNLYSTRNRVSVTGAAQQMVATLRQAQSRAISQYNNTAWGVHFDNTNPSAPFYALFSSTQYSTATAAETYPLPYNIHFFPGDIPEGSSTDIVFNSISGKASVASLVTSLWGKYTGGISGWRYTHALDMTNFGMAAAYYNGYVYSMGGYGAGCTVYYAQANGDGSLSAWKPALPLPSDGGCFYQSGIAYNGYLYNVGGVASAWVTSPVVSYAKINPDGSLQAWKESGNPLHVGEQFPALAAYNGYLYSLGGYPICCSAVTSTDEVVYAKINGDDGSIGSWSDTSFIPHETTYLPAIAYNGYLYSLGGNSNDGYARAYFNYAKIDSSGTLEAWIQGDPFPSYETSFAPAVIENGYFYSLANDGNGQSDFASIQAKINSSGTVGAWEQTGSLPDPGKYIGVVGSRQYFYLLGGSDPVSGYGTSSVIYTNVLGPNAVTISIGSQGVIGF